MNSTIRKAELYRPLNLYVEIEGPKTLWAQPSHKGIKSLQLI